MRTLHQRVRATSIVWSVFASCSLLSACEEEAITTGRGLGGASTATASTPSGTEPSAEAAEAPTPVPLTVHRDEEFVEAEANRDPFRSFVQSFVSRPARAEAVQREVVMARTGIEEMRLIAIVSGVANPSAMLVDRDGTGHTVHRGDYLGRPEVVQTGGEDAVPITLNWRVDRIRPDEVVLTRDDPTAPNRPPLTRVLPLRENSGEQQPI